MKASFLDAFADDAVLFRPGPVNDKAAPIAGAPEESGRWSRAVVDRGVARSRDFAWVIGTWRGDGVDAGHYVRVWHAQSPVWKIAIDVLAPLPTSR